MEGPRGVCQGCSELPAAPQARFCETEELTLLVNTHCGIRATCWATPAALNVGGLEGREEVRTALLAQQSAWITAMQLSVGFALHSS